MTEVTAAVNGVTAEPTPTERELIKISERVLGHEGVTVHDDLFDLGTTSLAFIRLLVTIRDQFGVSFTGAELGDDASIAHLASKVDAARNDSASG